MTSERLHRYALAAGHARGKRVVVAGERDPVLIASLRNEAREVRVVAIDPFGPAVRLPFDDDWADLVVAFAGLERIADAPGLLREARRVLTGDGVLCASFPARAGGAWTLGDVRALVARNFTACTIYAQRHIEGSLLYPLAAHAAHATNGARGANGANRAAGGASLADAPGNGTWFVRDAAGLRETIAFDDDVPAAYVAICATAELAPPSRSVLVDEGAAVAPPPLVPGSAAARAERAAAELAEHDKAEAELDETARVRLYRVQAELTLRDKQVARLSATALRSRDAMQHVSHVAHQRALQIEEQREALTAATARSAALEETERASAAAIARAADLESIVAQRDARIAELEALLAARDAHVGALEDEVVRREARVVEFVTAMAQREEMIAERDALLAEYGGRLNEHEQREAVLRGSAAELDASRAALDAELRAVLSSQSWRLTQPLRRVVRAVRRGEGER